MVSHKLISGFTLYSLLAVSSCSKQEAESETKIEAETPSIVESSPEEPETEGALVENLTDQIKQAESDLLLRLPSESCSSTVVCSEPAIFVIGKDGSISQKIHGDDRLVPLFAAREGDKRPSKEEIQELDDVVRLYTSIAKESATVIIKGDGEAKAQYVMNLLNVLAKHNITKVIFQKPEEGKEK